MGFQCHYPTDDLIIRSGTWSVIFFSKCLSRTHYNLKADFCYFKYRALDLVITQVKSILGTKIFKDMPLFGSHLCPLYPLLQFPSCVAFCGCNRIPEIITVTGEELISTSTAEVSVPGLVPHCFGLCPTSCCSGTKLPVMARKQEEAGTGSQGSISPDFHQLSRGPQLETKPSPHPPRPQYHTSNS